MPKPSQVFNWFVQNITDDPDDVKQSRWSIAQQKKAYQYGRAQLMRSFRRIEAAGFETTGYIQDNRDVLKPMSEITTEGELSEMLAQLVKAYSSPARSIVWQREHREAVLRGLHENEYDFVTEENLQDFSNYMEWARSQSTLKIYDSSQVADMYDLYGNFWNREDFKKNAEKYVEDSLYKDKVQPPKKGWKSAKQIHNAIKRARGLRDVGDEGSGNRSGGNRSRGNRTRKKR